MPYETKINENYKTSIPEEIREEFNLNINDSLLWDIDGDEIVLTPQKKRSFRELSGIIDLGEESNAVEISRQLAARNL